MESTSLGSMKRHVGNISFVTFKMAIVVSVGVNVSRGLSLSYGAFFFVVATTFFGTFDVRFNLLTTQHALPENTMEAVSELVLVVTDVLQQLGFFLPWIWTACCHLQNLPNPALFANLSHYWRYCYCRTHPLHGCCHGFHLFWYGLQSVLGIVSIAFHQLLASITGDFLQFTCADFFLTL